MLVRKIMRLSSMSVWQRECQLNFKVADLMIKPSVRMMMNEACCILCITYICYSG
ncbi:hypothetical protein ES288_A01G222500v1 [Gossypium darwinii]|uniref:Uncharacterized protein n=1 Tax=Gossypium darwinii TaxID=34276 RepID=A0A5D2HPL3_GOSDA|nr:hypothetical protein ES288_A01G222500v1 [Gossypium darwinii]